jgi:erythritol kinase
MHMAFVADADAVALNDACTGYTMCFPVPGGYAQMQSNMAGTLNIDWLLDLALEVLARDGVSRSRGDLLEGLDDLVLGAEAGGILFQPHISPAGERGPFLDPNARAGFIGLHNGHGYADLMRAVFDGLAMAARDCYRAMGRQPAEIRLTGGAARSVALRRIMASALNAPVRVSERAEAGAAGAAMMAAVSLGIYDTMDACVAQWVTPSLGVPEPPDPALISTYDRLYPAYAAAHRAVTPIWRMLADGRGDRDV